MTCRLSHYVYVIFNTFVIYDNFSDLIRKISPTYDFLKCIDYVTINSRSSRPCCKRDFNPTLNLETS